MHGVAINWIGANSVTKHNDRFTLVKLSYRKNLEMWDFHVVDLLLFWRQGQSDLLQSVLQVRATRDVLHLLN